MVGVGVVATIATLPACAAPPVVVSTATLSIPSRTFVVRGDIPGGVVEFEVPPARGQGQPVAFPVTVRATGAATIEGPIRAEVRFTASKQDILIRLIPTSAAPPVTVAPGTARSLVITWDGRADDGEIAQPDEYVLVLHFRVSGGTATEGATGLAFSVLR